MKKILMIFVLACFTVNLLAQKVVTGIVTDENQKPLSGVTVQVKGTTIGTFTDADGKFTLSVPADARILSFSFVGMNTVEVDITDRTTVNISMSVAVGVLEEVVVVGYGTQRRGSITGSIASVKADDIQELPVTDAGSALQGRATGVVALSAGNRPGQGVTIRIRGRRSLTATNDPLYVVDGIPYEGNIVDINPRDIKSMEILKDASATAIYGSRGANGVILITTNRGGNFPTTVSYSGQYGITSVLALPDMMNGEEYYQMKVVAQRPITAEEEDAHNRGVSTDWVSLVLDHGYQQNHQLTVRGGEAKTSFALSANYFKERGVIKTQDYTRYSFRVNLDHKVSDRFRLGTSMQFSNSLQNYGSNTFGAAINISPLAEPYDSEGNIIYRPGADPLLWNPLADYEEGNYLDERITMRLFGNIFAELDILKNLTYRINFGPDYREYRRGLFEGTNSMARQGSLPRVRKEHSRTLNYTIENILTYNLTTGIHDLNFTGVYSLQESTSENTYIEGENIPYETQLFHNLGTANTVRQFGSNLSEWGIMSFMGRVNYELLGKYMITLTGRMDGSSRLAKGHKWGFFPSVALMWRLNKEAFMEDQSIFDDLRLRASYGVTGNTGISPYQTRGSLAKTIYSFGGKAAYGYAPETLANPDLRWESSATANIGIDFSLMKNRISGSIEVYQTNTYDLLLQRQIPITSGFNYVMENIGQTRNRGWEINLVTRNITGRKFNWETTLNAFGNKEKIVDLYGTKKDDIGNRWFIGYPLTVWYDYKKLGVWQLNETEQAAVYNLKPGQIKVLDKNGDEKINQDDRVILGTDMPKLTVGLSSRMEYSGVDLSVLFFGVFGHTIYNAFEVTHATLQGRYNNLNVDYWTETNPTNKHPKPDGSMEYPYYSTSRGYFPGDFVKIKNIQIGYNIPNEVTSRIKVKKLRAFVNFDTPFIFSKLSSNLDPEVYGGNVTSDVPSVRMYSFGIQADF